MTLISKTAGALSLASCIYDIHKTALINSKNQYAKTSANTVIENSVGYQKANRVSYKDAQRKNWLAQGNFLAPFKEFGARVGGYISGFAKASIRYIPNFVLAATALCVKKYPKLANVAAVGLGIVEAWDFVLNSLKLNQRDDYLS